MGCKILFALALIFFGCCLASGRVFYVDGQGNVPRESYGIPGYPADENEQASRDLDLSFSTGDPDETGLVYPVKKVYAYAAPQRPMLELNREYERPAAYYRISDSPSRRIMYSDQSPLSEGNRKQAKPNGAPRKGELVLELRVIANNNNNIM